MTLSHTVVSQEHHGARNILAEAARCGNLRRKRAASAPEPRTDKGKFIEQFTWLRLAIIFYFFHFSWFSNHFGIIFKKILRSRGSFSYWNHQNPTFFHFFFIFSFLSILQILASSAIFIRGNQFFD